MKIVLATRNPGKLQELQELLEVDGVEFIPISEYDLEDVEETGKTFEENAVLKARYAAEHTGLPAVADDSGMSIRALSGYPGVISARCAGEDATDEEKRNFILKKMEGIGHRETQFVTCMALVNPLFLDEPICFTGVCNGELLKEARGEPKPQVQYDSIFYYAPVGLTFAEMTEDQKNAVSHRGNAAKQMKEYLENIFTKVCGDCDWFSQEPWSDEGECWFKVPTVNTKTRACIEYSEKRNYSKIKFREIDRYDGFVIRMTAATDCYECDCSSCYVEHFFWKHPSHNDVNPEVDSPSYISNQAACSRFVCPSCGYNRIV